MNNIHAQEALSRARGNTSGLNYQTIFAGFMARGIPSSEIIPRENVLTYKAWQAIGRQVKKGEKGVRVTTWIRYTDKTGQEVVNHNPLMFSTLHRLKGYKNEI